MSTLPTYLNAADQRYVLTVGRRIFTDWSSAVTPDMETPVSRTIPAGARGDVAVPRRARAGGRLTLTKQLRGSGVGTAELAELRALTGRQCQVSGRWIDVDGNDDGPGQQFAGVLVEAKASDYDVEGTDVATLQVHIETHGAS